VHRTGRLVGHIANSRNAIVGRSAGIVPYAITSVRRLALMFDIAR
jgi:hypothetical protein